MTPMMNIEKPMRLGRLVAGAVVSAVALIAIGFDARPHLAQRFSFTTDAYAAPAPTPLLSSPLRSLLGSEQWLNTKPLRAEDLQGKVVVVNFWTYSCINSLRTLPYLRAWADRYKDRGLVVVGVHAPEFAFERHLPNVSLAVGSLDVRYPIVIDNDLRIWKAFGNQAWPGFYFIGADGRVRHHAFGEGDYEKSEKLLQQLLSEARAAPVATYFPVAGGQGAQADPDFQNLRSPETYVGYERATGFASPGGAKHDVAARYRSTRELSLNHWALDGVWKIGSEFATLNDAEGIMTYRFHARDLHLVLATSTPGQVIRFRVTVDGMSPGADHGFDVDAEGRGSVQESRLYQLIRQTGPVIDRNVEIEFLDPGVRAYAFTFG